MSKEFEVFDTLDEANAHVEQTNKAAENNNSNNATGENGGGGDDKFEQRYSEKFKSDLTSMLGDQFDSLDKVKQHLTAQGGGGVQLAKEDAEALDFYKNHQKEIQLARYASMEGANVPLYLELGKLDLSKIEPVEALIRRKMFETGISREQAELVVNNDYARLEGQNYTDVEKALAAAKLGADGPSAIKWLKDFQDQNRLPEPERQRLAAQAKDSEVRSSRRDAWKPEIEKLVGAFQIKDSREVTYGQYKLPIEVDFRIADNKRDEFKGILEDIVKNGDFEVTPQNVELIKDFAAAKYIMKNVGTFAETIMDSTIKSMHNTIGKKYFGMKDAKYDGAPDENGKYKIEDEKNENTGGKKSVGLKKSW